MDGQPFCVFGGHMAIERRAMPVRPLGERGKTEQNREKGGNKPEAIYAVERRSQVHYQILHHWIHLIIILQT